MYVKSLISVSTPQERAIKAKAAPVHGFMVDGEFIATVKRKPSKLQKLENDLKRLQDNYDTCVRNGMTEMAARYEAAIKKTNKQIAKAMAA